MIVVTGSCRTGTSLVMQTLKLLGVEVAGYSFHDDFPSQKLNPKGYWELPIKETVNGCNDEKYKNMAVKLFGYQLSKTRPKNVDKLIVCTRKKEDALRSSLELFRVDAKLDNEVCNLDFANLVYEENYKLINDYIIKNSICFLPVSYDLFLDNPSETVRYISDYLNLCYNIESVENVKKEKEVWQ